MTPVATRISEYSAVLASIVGGTLWIGNVAGDAKDAKTAVAALPAVANQVSALDERTKAMSTRLDDIKSQQAENTRILLEAIREANKHDKGK